MERVYIHSLFMVYYKYSTLIDWGNTRKMSLANTCTLPMVSQDRVGITMWWSVVSSYTLINANWSGTPPPPPLLQNCCRSPPPPSFPPRVIKCKARSKHGRVTMGEEAFWLCPITVRDLAGGWLGGGGRGACLLQQGQSNKK